MATDRMYELAFRFKEKKLWNQVSSDELFAVTLSDGEIGYCSILGELGEHTALALYVGKESLAGYALLQDVEMEDLREDELLIGEVAATQNCIQCSFEKKYFLSNAEVLEVQQYAKAHHIALRGKNAFPQFVKYQPGRYPWHYDSALDEQRICEALSAGIYLYELLQHRTKTEIGLCSIEKERILLLSYQDGRWIVGDTPVPEITVTYPEPAFTDDLKATRIKKKTKTEVWECGTMWLPAPFQKDGEEDEAPIVPFALVSVNQRTGMVMQVLISDGEVVSNITDEFASNLLDDEEAPHLILCRDSRCFALLKDFCKKAGIRLEISDDLEELNDAMMDYLDQAEEEEEPDIETIIEMLSSLKDEELAQLPKSLINTLSKDEALPAKLRKRLGKLKR